jgi:hypothetical protein
MASHVQRLVPEARVAVAHGQMAEGELETVMMDYLRGDYDVLVCTSIIESGIDIPQANTLIVEHADMFGLAQLYQIRGRVGRSRERAYAYLMYDSAAALTPEAAGRLAALSDYTELGAGFQIAMRDLELRGAGNLLGDEQSGHVAALGFELYMQMLDEAVRNAGSGGDQAIAGEDEELPEPVRLDVNVDAYVPPDYVSYEQAKIEIHRRVAGALEVAEVQQLRDELEDRFGPARADQVRPSRRLGRELSRRPSRRDADRTGLRARAQAARGAARGAVRIRSLAGLGPRAPRWSGALPDRDQGRRRAALAHARGGMRKREQPQYPATRGCPMSAHGGAGSASSVARVHSTPTCSLASSGPACPAHSCWSSVFSLQELLKHASRSFR